MTTMSSTLWATSEREVAGDEDGASPPRLGPHEVAHPANAGRIEAVSRFVEDQHRGVAEQGCGDGEALAHAHRVALDPPVGGGGEVDLLEHVLDPVARMVSGGGEHAQVVAGGAAGMEAGVLEHGPDVGAGTGQLAVAPAGECCCPVVGMDQSEQDSQRGALAGAVRAEEAGDSACGHGEREAGNGLDGAEALAQTRRSRWQYPWPSTVRTAGCGDIGRKDGRAMRRQDERGRTRPTS